MGRDVPLCTAGLRVELRLIKEWFAHKQHVARIARGEIKVKPSPDVAEFIIGPAHGRGAFIWVTVGQRPRL
jgi:hypothetical protein